VGLGLGLRTPRKKESEERKKKRFVRDEKTDFDFRVEQRVLKDFR